MEHIPLSPRLEAVADRAAKEWLTHVHTGWVPFAVVTLIEAALTGRVERESVTNRARYLYNYLRASGTTPTPPPGLTASRRDSPEAGAEYAERRRTLMEAKQRREAEDQGERERISDEARALNERARASAVEAEAAERRHWQQERVASLERQRAEVEARRQRKELEATRQREELEAAQAEARRLAAIEADRRRAQAAAKRAQIEHERRQRWFNRPAPAPDPQPYGVSHEGAEHLCAAWMRHLGVVDAEVTRVAGDGGIDVDSASFIAQVKNYAGSVAVADIRALFGVAVAGGKRALLFTSGSITSEGLAFAERTGLALMRYDAPAGTLIGLNRIGEACVEYSIPEAMPQA